MRMTSEQRIAAPRQRVWEALNDPEILRASVPGCQTIDKESDLDFTGTVEVKVGPIGARFKGIVSLEDIDPGNSYTLVIEGSGGIAGSAKGSAKVRLSEDAGNTIIHYDVEAQVGGRMAQLGGPVIDATAKQLAGVFFGRFGDIVSGVAKPAAPARAKIAAAAGAPAMASSAAAPAGGFPIAWILATVVAALSGFLVGHGQGGVGSEWAGLAIGMLLIVVAGAAFEYGRRAAAPVIMLDNALLQRLMQGAKE